MSNECDRVNAYLDENLLKVNITKTDYKLFKANLMREFKP